MVGFVYILSFVNVEDWVVLFDIEGKIDLLFGVGDGFVLVWMNGGDEMGIDGVGVFWVIGILGCFF